MSMLILDSGHFSCIKKLQIFSGFSPKGIHGNMVLYPSRPSPIPSKAGFPSLPYEGLLQSLLSHKLFPSTLIKA